MFGSGCVDGRLLTHSHRQQQVRIERVGRKSSREEEEAARRMTSSSMLIEPRASDAVALYASLSIYVH